MISFEESPQALQRNCADMSLKLDEVIGKGLHLIDGRLPSNVIETGDFDLGGLIAVISSMVATHGIKRLAIDGLDALFPRGTNDSSRRREMLRVLSWLSESELTALLTLRAEDGREGVPRHLDFTDFAADGVVQLRTTMLNDFSRRTLQIIKLRGSKFITGEHPYTLSENGMHVLSLPTQGERGVTDLAATRLSTGVERLDRMLEGGHPAGSVILLSGLPGTSKTTLSAAFLAAGCRAGEKVLFCGFDEPADVVVHNAQLIGIDLGLFQKSGLLRVQTFIPSSAIGDEHYVSIEALINEHEPTRIVIDPVTALERSGGPKIADLITTRLAMLFKSRHITALFTADSDSQGELESTNTRFSTVPDTWIHLSSEARHGERNRTLTVIKARGTAHSNQIREILLSSEGVNLADVYSDGASLLGTARLHQDQEETKARLLVQERHALELKRLDEEREALTSELKEIQRRLDEILANRTEMVKRTAASGAADLADEAAVRAARFGDPVMGGHGGLTGNR